MIQIAAKNKHIPLRSEFIDWINILSQDIDIKKQNLTIRVVEATESQALNLRFRNQDKPTNVLSFTADLPAIAKQEYLGDIVICASIVEQEARAQQKPLRAHWAHMVVHGFLHLQGYDHQSDAEAEQMQTLEINWLAKLDFANPYATVAVAK